MDIPEIENWNRFCRLTWGNEGGRKQEDKVGRESIERGREYGERQLEFRGIIPLNNGEYRVSIGHLFFLIKVPSSGTGLHSIKLLAKVGHMTISKQARRLPRHLFAV